MLNPEWRKDEREKFITNKGFNINLKAGFGGKHDKQVWQSVGENSLSTKYVGGYEETGDIGRMRDKTKEVGKRCFSSAGPRDIWSNRLNESISIRKYVADKAMEEMNKGDLKHKQDIDSVLDVEINTKRGGDRINDDERIEEKKEENEFDKIIPKFAINAGKRVTSRKSNRDKTITPRGGINATKPDIKLYKKSLEDPYFIPNELSSNPSKTTKQNKRISQLSFGPSQMMKQQMSHDHWVSGFPGGMDEVERKLKENRNIRTPADNFKPPEEFYKIPSRSGTRGSAKKCCI